MSDNYITKEKVLSFVEEMEKRTHGDDLITKSVLVTTKCVKDFVMHMPPEDVQPVVHGEWIFNPDGMDWNIPAWVCSECHGKNDMIPTYIQGKDKMIKVEHPLRWAGSKYCPNCGAKMDRKGADND